MGFKDNIFNSLNLNSNTLYSYRVTLIGKTGAYVEGAKRIIDITKKEIIIEINLGKLIIKGDFLNVKSYVNQDLVVSGKISHLEVIDK